jgi:hypothetical protein
VHDAVASFIRSRFRSSLPGGLLTHDAPLFSTGVILMLFASFDSTFIYRGF